MGGKEDNFLVAVFKENKVILLITAFTVGVYATTFSALQARVEHVESRVCDIEKNQSDIAVVKNDVAWIKKMIERRLK